MIEFENWLHSYPQLAQKGILAGKKIKVSKKTNEVVFCGMGGSSAPALILKPLFEKKGVKCKIVQTFRLPQRIGREALIVISSYSGNTAETIKIFKDALKMGRKVLVISSDGKLLSLARRKKVAAIEIEKGLLPRLALPIFLFVYLTIFSKLLGITSKEIVDSIKLMASENYVKKAREIAEKIVDTLPIIYTFEDYYGIAYRFKTQINENAKTHAFVSKLPEASHNEIEGYEDKWISHKISSLFIVGNLNRFEKEILESFKRVISDKVAQVIEIFPKGKTPLQKMIYLICLVDWISYFLARLKGIDPSKTSLIEKYKKQLTL